MVGGADRRRTRPGCRCGRRRGSSRPDGFGSRCATDRRLALQRCRPDRCPQPVDPGIHRTGCKRRDHRHRRVAGRRSQRGRQGGGDGRPLGRVGRSGNPVPRHLRPRHAHGRHHRRARPGGEPCACRCASRVVRRSGTWRRHRVGEGGWAQWCRRCVAGDRRYRLGGTACCPTEHPRAQPVVRHRLDPAVHHRPVGVCRGAGVEGWHRGGDGRRERRQGGPRVVDAGARSVRHRRERCRTEEQEVEGASVGVERRHGAVSRPRRARCVDRVTANSRQLRRRRAPGRVRQSGAVQGKRFVAGCSSGVGRSGRSAERASHAHPRSGEAVAHRHRQRQGHHPQRSEVLRERTARRGEGSHDSDPASNAELADVDGARFARGQPWQCAPGDQRHRAAG